MLTILKASAGSGKTFALTREYIRLLLGYKDSDGHYRLNRNNSDRHRAILAITFTNKATDEMKSRIIHELAILAEMEPCAKGIQSPYTEYLIDCFRCSHQELKAEASRALSHLLFDFNFFNVSTIDAFFQFILRSFAYEAELEGDYEVDIDSKKAIADGLDDMLTSLSTDASSPESEELTRWISNHLNRLLDEGKSISIFNRQSKTHTDLVSLIAGLANERFMSKFDSMMEYLDGPKLRTFEIALSKRLNEIRQNIIDKSRNALDLIEANPLPSGNYRSNLINFYRKAKVNGDFDDESRTMIGVALGTTSIADKKGMAFFDNGCNDDLLDAIAAPCVYIHENIATIRLFKAIRSSLFVMGILKGIFSRIQASRLEKNVLLLSDTNSLLRRIIGDDEASFIFERIGVNLHHFLIDEFQDTSRLQWENLSPLVKESQSHGNDNLIIGDEKQCIYRFRSSDPTLLKDQVENDIPAPVAVSGDNPSENTNYRSSREVVDFNNRLFGAISSLLNFTDIYSNVCQQIHRRLHRGYVNCRRIECARTDEFKPLAIDRMIDEIKREVKAGYRGCDIAVLIRKNPDAEDVVNALVAAFSSDEELKPYGLKVVSDDAMRIDSAPSVLRILSVLRSIATASLADGTEIDTEKEFDDRQFKSRQQLINVKNRYEHGRGEGLSPSEALTQAIRQSHSAINPPIDISSAKCLSLPSLIERIVAHYFPQGTVPSGEMIYLMAFEDVVIDYCAANPPDIQSFLRWWDTTGNKSEVMSAPDVNAVRVMTIHKSKGLEFKCVHIPLLYSEMVKISDPQWFDPIPLPGIPGKIIPPLLAIKPTAKMRQTPYANDYEKLARENLLDETNVLYVAFTRAVDELIVTYYRKSESARSAAKPASTDYLNATSGRVIDDALKAIGYIGPETVIGEPCTPSEPEKARRRVTSPESIVPIPRYNVDERESLWASTCLEKPDTAISRRREGIIFHSLLSAIDRRDDIPKAISAAVRCGALPRNRRDEARQYLESAFDSCPQTAIWFSDKAVSLRERSIVDVDGRTVRPDRVVSLPDGSIVVIDFKFGDKEESGHEKQVVGYMNLLRRLGYKSVSGYLWYVALSKVKEVR